MEPSPSFPSTMGPTSVSHSSVTTRPRFSTRSESSKAPLSLAQFTWPMGNLASHGQVIGALEAVDACEKLLRQLLVPLHVLQSKVPNRNIIYVNTTKNKLN